MKRLNAHKKLSGRSYGHARFEGAELVLDELLIDQSEYKNDKTIALNENPNTHMLN